MTEGARRPSRWPRGRIKALAWITGAMTFVASGAVLAAHPKPAAASGGGTKVRASGVRVIRRTIIRKVIIVDPAQPSAGSTQPVVVSAPTSTSSSNVGTVAPPPTTTTTSGS